MTREIKIGNRMVGDGQPAYIIAEIGINHNGDLGIARQMIDAAVQLLDQPEDRARLSGAAMHTYLERFHVERAVATLVGGADE